MRGRVLKIFIGSLMSLVVMSTVVYFGFLKQQPGVVLAATIQEVPQLNKVRIADAKVYIDSTGDVFEDVQVVGPWERVSRGINIEGKYLEIFRSKVTIDGEHNLEDVTIDNHSTVYHSYTNRDGQPLRYFARNDYWAGVVKGYINFPMNSSLYQFNFPSVDDAAEFRILWGKPNESYNGFQCDSANIPEDVFTNPKYMTESGNLYFKTVALRHNGAAWTNETNTNENTKFFLKEGSQCSAKGYPFILKFADVNNNTNFWLRYKYQNINWTDIPTDWLYPTSWLHDFNSDKGQVTFQYWISKGNDVPNRSLSNASQVVELPVVSLSNLNNGNNQTTLRWWGKSLPNYDWFPTDNVSPIGNFDYNSSMNEAEMVREPGGGVKSVGRAPWGRYVGPLGSYLNTRGITFKVKNLTLKGNSRIYVKGRGYPGGFEHDDSGFGPGRGYRYGGLSEGGSYGGTGWYKGGSSAFTPNSANRYYGSIDDPRELGSGGGNHHDDPSGGKHYHNAGGFGGGKIVIEASGTVTADNSSINASGGRPNPVQWWEGHDGESDVEDGAGAGSGGTINIRAPSVFLRGNSTYLVAEGGATNYLRKKREDPVWGYPQSKGPGGGGGRIAVLGLQGKEGVDYILAETNRGAAKTRPTISAEGGDKGLFEGVDWDKVNPNAGYYGGEKGTIWLGDRSASASTTPAAIVGDIYSSSNINLPSYFVDNKSIVAFGKNLTDTASFKSVPAHLLPDYASAAGPDIKWTSSITDNLYSQLERNIKQLENDRAKTPTRTNVAIWNLQSGNDDPGGSVESKPPPEGGVWRVAGNYTIPASGVTFSGKGTIIVNGKLTVNGPINIDLNNPENIVGFIVKGAGGIEIKPGASRIYAILYAHGGGLTMTSNNSMQYTVKGLLAARDNVVLPNSFATGSTITYDTRFAKSPLPGFKHLQELVRGELAP